MAAALVDLPDNESTMDRGITPYETLLMDAGDLYHDAKEKGMTATPEPRNFCRGLVAPSPYEEIQTMLHSLPAPPNQPTLEGVSTEHRFLDYLDATILRIRQQSLESFKIASYHYKDEMQQLNQCIANELNIVHLMIDAQFGNMFKSGFGNDQRLSYVRTHSSYLDAASKGEPVREKFQYPHLIDCIDQSVPPEYRNPVTINRLYHIDSTHRTSHVIQTVLNGEKKVGKVMVKNIYSQQQQEQQQEEERILAEITAPGGISINAVSNVLGLPAPRGSGASVSLRIQMNGNICTPELKPHIQLFLLKTLTDRAQIQQAFTLPNSLLVTNDRFCLRFGALRGVPVMIHMQSTSNPYVNIYQFGIVEITDEQKGTIRTKLNDGRQPYEELKIQILQVYLPGLATCLSGEIKHIMDFFFRMEIRYIEIQCRNLFDQWDGILDRIPQMDTPENQLTEEQKQQTKADFNASRILLRKDLPTSVLENFKSFINDALSRCKDFPIKIEEIRSFMSKQQGLYRSNRTIVEKLQEYLTNLPYSFHELLGLQENQGPRLECYLLFTIMMTLDHSAFGANVLRGGTYLDLVDPGPRGVLTQMYPGVQRIEVDRIHQRVAESHVSSLLLMFLTPEIYQTLVPAQPVSEMAAVSAEATQHVGQKRKMVEDAADQGNVEPPARVSRSTGGRIKNNSYYIAWGVYKNIWVNQLTSMGVNVHYNDVTLVLHDLDPSHQGGRRSETRRKKTTRRMKGRRMKGGSVFHAALRGMINSLKNVYGILNQIGHPLSNPLRQLIELYVYSYSPSTQPYPDTISSNVTDVIVHLREYLYHLSTNVDVYTILQQYLDEYSMYYTQYIGIIAENEIPMFHMKPCTMDEIQQEVRFYPFLDFRVVEPDPSYKPSIQHLEVDRIISLIQSSPVFPLGAIFGLFMLLQDDAYESNYGLAYIDAVDDLKELLFLCQKRKIDFKVFYTQLGYRLFMDDVIHPILFAVLPHSALRLITTKYFEMTPESVGPPPEPVNQFSKPLPTNAAINNAVRKKAMQHIRETRKQRASQQKILPLSSMLPKEPHGSKGLSVPTGLRGHVKHRLPRILKGGTSRKKAKNVVMKKRITRRRASNS